MHPGAEGSRGVTDSASCFKGSLGKGGKHGLAGPILQMSKRGLSGGWL